MKVTGVSSVQIIVFGILTGVVAGIHRSPHHHGVHIAFSSLMTMSHTYGLNQVVLFDKILTNDGEGYSSETGIFTAPVPGTYLLTWAIMTLSAGTDVVTGLAVNGEFKSFTDSSGSGADLNSQTVILNLDLDDQVWIAVKHGSNIFADAQKRWYYSSFSGYLLYM